jgi:hypothetical protein
MAEMAAQMLDEGGILESDGAGVNGPRVELVDWDPEAETKMVAAMLYPYTHLSEAQVEDRVRAMGGDERAAVVRQYTGERANRRHRPGRALERCQYRFDVVSDYGAFRDLQRHRMLTVEWQGLTPHHGYTMPAVVGEAGQGDLYAAAMERSATLYEALCTRFSTPEAAYAVTLAHRIRYNIQMNAREAMHMLELRTTPQGHPEYRDVCQQMHRLIAGKAGHEAVAAMMTFVDHEAYGDDSLGRLAAEQRAQARRQGLMS